MFEPFGTELEAVIDQIHAEIADDTVDYFVFYRSTEFLQNLDRTVAWVPVTFKCERPARANTSAYDAIATDFINVECWIKCSDWSEIFAIRRRILTACRKLFGGAIVPTNGLFPTQLKKKVNIEEAFGEFDPVLVQHFIFEMDVQRDETSDGIYRATVNEIDIVDKTQITTTGDGILTPDEQLEITE